MSVRAAVVTGANRGIGEAVALRLAREGWRVAIVFRKSLAQARRVLKLLHVSSPQSIMVRADVTRQREAERAIRHAVRTFGRLDLLVNNVGEFYETPVSRMDVDPWERLLRSNLHSAMYCAKAALPVMRRQRGGTIINVGGTGLNTLKGNPKYVAYAMAKTALVVFTKSLAQAEAARGVRVNVINPGFIRTYAYSEEEVRAYAAMVPMKRLGEPSEIAATIRFLASEEASYITGAAIDVGGGLWV